MAADPAKPNVVAVPPDPLTAEERKRLAAYDATLRNRGTPFGTAAGNDDYQRLRAKRDQAETAVTPPPSPTPQPADPTGTAATPPKSQQPDLFRRQLDNTAALADQLPAPPTAPKADTEPYALAEPEQTGPGYDQTQDPLRDFSGPNDPAADRNPGDDKPLDVNIVGSIPLPVYMTQGGQPGAGGGPGGEGVSGQPVEHDAYGNPIDPEHKPLAGMTVNEAFQKFSGGYAAGYPIHNLKTLYGNLTNIGAGALSRMSKTRVGKSVTKWFRNTKQGQQTARRKKAGGDLTGFDPNATVGDIVDRIEKQQGGPAPAGGGGGKAGGLGGVTAGDVIGSAVKGVTAFAGALVSASQEVYSFARAQEEEVRRLSEFNAALAGAVAVLDVGRLERDIRMGQATEGTATELTQSIDRFEAAIAPLQEGMTNLANTVGSTLLDLISTGVTTLNGVLDGIMDLVGIEREPETPTHTESAWDYFDRLAAGAGTRRDWPGGGGISPGGPGWSP